ncbi:hypothetical protein PoB_001676200 [Plakobranchus ocellatus]|uniref:Uncharacterized protein n=1 Tax=Plakobranchus ocellatus TaxID=259542 RepID=A0AAV3Z4T0_9GAST|nr:hypothetical protein PoB_001676200 [Plakobranchus ocellatus]
MSKRAGFFEDLAGLIRVHADESLEEELNSLYGDYGTYNRSMNYSGIRSHSYSSKQLKKESIDRSTGDVTSEPPMNSFKPELTVTFTCQGRCGKEMLNLKHLRCMDDPEREQDKSLLHDSRSSPCLSHLEILELPDSNGAHTAMPRDAIILKMPVLAFIILVIAFIKTIQSP